MAGDWLDRASVESEADQIRLVACFKVRHHHLARTGEQLIIWYSALYDHL